MTEKKYKDYLDEYIEDNYYEKKMLDNNSEYCKISDLAKRFIEIDKEYGQGDLNLTQILANIRMTKHYSLEEIKSIEQNFKEINMDRRRSVNDFLSENIIPLLRYIDNLAEQQHLKLCEYIDIDEQEKEYVMSNLSIIRENIEVIKELIGAYR